MTAWSARKSPNSVRPSGSHTCKTSICYSSFCACFIQNTNLRSHQTHLLREYIYLFIFFFNLSHSHWIKSQVRVYFAFLNYYLCWLQFHRSCPRTENKECGARGSQCVYIAYFIHKRVVNMVILLMRTSVSINPKTFRRFLCLLYFFVAISKVEIR